MTTTEKSDLLTAQATISEPYEIVRDGESIECRTVELFGQSLEVCDDGRSIRQVLIDLVGESPWGYDDETEARLVDFLNQYRVTQGKSEMK